MTHKNEKNRDVFISALGFGILYYFFPRTEIILVGSVYVVLCFFFNNLKKSNHKFWHWTTRIIQSVTSPILFGAIFFFILLPLGLLFRVFKKKRGQVRSTFKEVHQTIDTSFFEVPW